MKTKKNFHTSGTVIFTGFTPYSHFIYRNGMRLFSDLLSKCRGIAAFGGKTLNIGFSPAKEGHCTMAPRLRYCLLLY